MDADTTDAAWSQVQSEEQMFDMLSTLYTVEEMVETIDPDWTDHYLDAYDYIRELRRYSPGDYRDLLNQLATEAGVEDQWKI